jgi:hypothetical protein
LERSDTGVKLCSLTAFQIFYEEFKKRFSYMDGRTFIRTL